MPGIGPKRERGGLGRRKRAVKVEAGCRDASEDVVEGAPG